MVELVTWKLYRPERDGLDWRLERWAQTKGPGGYLQPYGAPIRTATLTHRDPYRLKATLPVGADALPAHGEETEDPNLVAVYGSVLVIPVFVFGSNLAGRHGKGAAEEARRLHGARVGIGSGPTGNAYAIPTKDAQLRPLPLATIGNYVQEFIKYACATPHERFYVTRVGCGLAGYTEDQIRPLFVGAPGNCEFTWNTQ